MANGDKSGKNSCKAVVKKETSEIVPHAPEGAWGSEGANTRDILIPRLLLMQGLSDLVSQERAKMGDIVNSVSGKVLGGKDKPIKFIPIMTFSTWAIFEKGEDDKLEWKRMEPMTAENQDLPWEEEVNGKYTRRDQCLNFYVLLDSDALAADALPYVMSFRRTSYKEGQKLSTHFLTSRRLNKAPATKTYALSCSKESNDHGTYYVFRLEEGTATEAKKIDVAYSWYQTIKSGVAKVDVESEFKTSNSTEVPKEVKSQNGAEAQF